MKPWYLSGAAGIGRWKERSDADYGFRPMPAQPVVFHLFGNQKEPESLVLTEDDYIEFFFNTSRNERLIPPRIQKHSPVISYLSVSIPQIGHARVVAVY